MGFKINTYVCLFFPVLSIYRKKYTNTSHIYIIHIHIYIHAYICSHTHLYLKALETKLMYTKEKTTACVFDKTPNSKIDKS